MSRLAPAAVRIRSPQTLAGSRLNRRHPVARQSRWSDAAVARALPVHVLVRGWGGVPGDCGVECSCGVGFDGFGTIGEAEALRRDRADHPRRPNHAARAVSLDACFPGTTGVFVDAAMGGRTKVRQIAAVAGSYGRSAATMTMQARLDRYVTQRGAPSPRQYRRLWHKARRAGELV